MQFCFMPNDAVFILKKMQEEYHAKKEKKLCMCFVDLVKAFDRVLRKVLGWALRKKGIPVVLVRSVMSLYEGAKARARVDSELLVEFEFKVWMYQGYVLSHFLFAMVMDLVTKYSSEGVLSVLLYADGFILMCETIKGLRNKFLMWKEVF